MNILYIIPRNSVEIFRRNKIPRNSVKIVEFRVPRNSVKNSDVIPWKFRRNSVKIVAEFRENFRWNSVKTPVGFFVFNSYLYEGIPTNTFFRVPRNFAEFRDKLRRNSAEKFRRNSAGHPSCQWTAVFNCRGYIHWDKEPSLAWECR